MGGGIVGRQRAEEPDPRSSGHKANIVLADGVEYGGYVNGVVALNAK